MSWSTNSLYLEGNDAKVELTEGLRDASGKLIVDVQTFGRNKNETDDQLAARAVAATDEILLVRNPAAPKKTVLDIPAVRAKMK